RPAPSSVERPGHERPSGPGRVRQLQSRRPRHRAPHPALPRIVAPARPDRRPAPALLVPFDRTLALGRPAAVDGSAEIEFCNLVGDKLLLAARETYRRGPDEDPSNVGYVAIYRDGPAFGEAWRPIALLPVNSESRAQLCGFRSDHTLFVRVGQTIYRAGPSSLLRLLLGRD